MSVRPAYTRFYSSNWRSGTLNLSLEEEGLYIRVSAFQMECGQPIPTDWKEGARLLNVQPLKYRKVIDSLIAKGKLIEKQEGIVCERAIAEYWQAFKSVKGSAPNPPTNPDTYPHTYPHTNPDTYPVSMGVEAEKEQINQGDFRKRREEKKEREDICAVSTAPGAVSDAVDVKSKQPSAAEQAFEQFWLLFPAERRRGKGHCRQLFTSIVTGRHRKLRGTAEQIIAAVKIGSGIDPKFPPMPQTWLNQGRWEDKPEAAKPKPQLVYAYHPEDDEYRVFKGEKPLKENWRELLAELEAKKTA